MDSTSDVNEKERIRALGKKYHILDTAPEPQFDDLAALAASICDTPMAFITPVDKSRQWFKARVNFRWRKCRATVDSVVSQSGNEICLLSRMRRHTRALPMTRL